jgi:excisionase family DNA binding protein
MSRSDFAARPTRPAAVSRPAPRLVVQLSEADLRQLVADVVQAAVDEVARPLPPALLDTEQLCHELGVSAPTVRRMRDEGMPVVRIGDVYRYELAAVLAWLRSRGRDSQ